MSAKRMHHPKYDAGKKFTPSIPAHVVLNQITASTWPDVTSLCGDT